MPIGPRARSGLLFLTLSGLLLLLFVCYQLLNPSGNQRVTHEDFQATVAVEQQLLANYGVEVRDQIEYFESRWSSLEAHLIPDIQAELAVGRYLEYYGYARRGEDLYDAPFWLITRSAVVNRIRVLEYDTHHFKAMVCVVKDLEKVTPNGVSLEVLSPLRICGVYVFVREVNNWKLAGFFNTADSRDWDYAPEWLKEIIGELPE